MTKLSKLGFCAGLLALAAASQSAYAQSDLVTIKRATELREAPGETARSLGPLALQTQVTRLAARQGPWIEVRTAQGATGWIHMFDAGTAPPAQGGNAATGALRGITDFFGRGTAQSANRATGTATIGIRGLGAEDIANAQPNLAAVAQVEGMRIDANQARQFATAASLAQQNVAELPIPVPPNQAGTPGAAGAAGNRSTTGGDR